MPPWTFKAVVREDPAKTLKGTWQCRLTAEGLRLRRGKGRDLAVPRGAAARHLAGNRFAVELEGREVEFAVAEFTLYQRRLARDLCRFLRGEGPPPARADYAIPAYLYAPAALPLGIPVLTQGGALPAALGVGLAALAMAAVRRDDWSAPVRSPAASRGTRACARGGSTGSGTWTAARAGRG